MSDLLFKELDLARHAKLLQRAVGLPHSVAVCDRDGEVVWASESGIGSPIRGAISETIERQGGLVATTGMVQQAETEGDQALVYAPVRAGTPQEVGWLAILAAQADLSDRFESVEKVLEDVSAGIGSEYRLNHEIKSLAGELSGRYDELNLVYSFEGQARAFDQGTVGAQALLQNFADFLNVNLAAFVLSARAEPIYATTASQPIPDRDLVLTQLRGNLFRFVSISKSPLIMNEPNDPRRLHLFVNMPYRVLACPVIQSSRVAAMLVLLRRPDLPEFSNGDRNLGEVIAGQTAIIMRNQDMMGKLRRFAEQMAAALIEAVEAKDVYTRGHSERVQGISVELARGADLLASDVEDISWGALLHDVGKIGIPDSILCKAGRLTRDEYTLVKMHPERSYEIIRHIEYLRSNALDGARYHQEKFDGTGYPFGLKGAEIPLHARLIAVGDTYDAITSSRAYRPGQAHDAAMAEISRVAGTQLDPQFVRVFEKMCKEDLAWLKKIAAPPAHRDE